MRDTASRIKEIERDLVYETRVPTVKEIVYIQAVKDIIHRLGFKPGVKDWNAAGITHYAGYLMTRPRPIEHISKPEQETHGEAG